MNWDRFDERSDVIAVSPSFATELAFASRRAPASHAEPGWFAALRKWLLAYRLAGLYEGSGLLTNSGYAVRG